VASDRPPIVKNIIDETVYKKLEYIESMLKGLGKIIDGDDDEVFFHLKAAERACSERIFNFERDVLSEISRSDPPTAELGEAG